MSGDVWLCKAARLGFDPQPEPTSRSRMCLDSPSCTARQPLRVWVESGMRGLNDINVEVFPLGDPPVPLMLFADS
jgi:hypothetical protein